MPNKLDKMKEAFQPPVNPDEYFIDEGYLMSMPFRRQVLIFVRVGGEVHRFAIDAPQLITGETEPIYNITTIDVSDINKFPVVEHSVNTGGGELPPNSDWVDYNPMPRWILSEN